MARSTSRPPNSASTARATERSGATSLLALHGATLLFGLAGALGKLIALPAPLLTFWRVVIASMGLGVVALALRLPVRLERRRDGVALFGAGALLALHWAAFFQAIVVSSVAIGVLAFSTFPLFTVAFEAALRRRQPPLLKLAAALLTLGGVALLVPRLSLGDATTAGVLWGVLAGATFALLAIVNSRLRRRYSSMTVSLWQDASATLWLLPTLWLVPGALSGALFDGRRVLLLLALGLGCTALAHTLFIAGLRHIPTQTASLIAALEPVWGIVFGLALLGEVPTPRTLLGGLVIVAALLIGLR